MNKNRLILLVLCISLSSFISSMVPNEQLIEAARTGNIQQAQEALTAGADVNALTPLDYAVARRNIALIKFLLNSGADVNVKDKDGATVLHQSVMMNNSIAKEITQLLLASGADVNAQTCLGCTPLHYAVDAKSAFEIKCNLIKLLLKAGADSDAQDNTGWTPLHFAVKSDTGIARILVENGARIHLKNDHNLTALDVAKKHEKQAQAVVKILSELPSLKDLSARRVRKQINQGIVTLEHIKNNIPEELYELVIEYL